MGFEGDIMAATFKVEIDWTKASWVDESVYVRRVRVRGGFDANEQSVAAPGMCVIVLDNATQRFSPGYAAGALYGNLLPRRPVRVTATDGVTTWTLFRGFIKTIMPDGGDFGGARCVLECADALEILDRQRVGVALEASKDVDEAVSAVVDLAYTPPDTSYSDNGDSLSHYGRSWLPEKTTAVQALREICDAVYGRFYVDRDGTATYIARDDRLDSSGSAAISVGVSDAYWQRMRDAQPANLIGLWRLNESSGTNADDSSSENHDGTYAGVTLAALLGPDGENAPSFDGINDEVELGASGVGAAFDGAECTLVVWIKVTDASVWTDGARHVGIMIYVNGFNLMRIRSETVNGLVSWRREGSNSASNVSKSGVSDTGWICVGMTVSESADELKGWWNGVQEGSTQTGLGTWVGTPGTIRIGSSGSGAFWDGSVALVGLWDAALSDAKMLSLGSV